MKKLTLMGLALASSSLLAAPSAFQADNCEPLLIDNQTTSTLIRDHKDCSKVWVMPPQMGTTTTRHFKKSGNLGFCSEMKNLQKTSRRITSKIEILEEEVGEKTPEIKRAERKLRIANNAMKEALSKDTLNIYRGMKERLETIEGSIEVLLTQLNTCSQNCSTIETEYNELRMERKALTREMRAERSKNLADIRIYERAKAKYESAKRNFEFVDDEVDRIVEKKMKLHARLFNLYQNYAKLEGGYIGVNYDLNWDENVQALEASYPQYNFSKVETKDARIYANFIGSTDKDAYLSSLPMVLDYSLGGLKYQPYGEEREPEISSLPSEIQGDIRLSVVGACPYYYSNFLDDSSGQLQVNPNAESTQFGYGLSASYKYPAVFKFNMKASYNLYKFYKKVVRSGSSGGFFSKKSWKKVHETKIDKDTFKIEWLDEAALYSKEEKEVIRKTVKEELVMRALQNMAQPAGSRPAVTAIDTFTPEHGALVIAKGIEETCGWYSYKCKAASWILKGLNSVFGSSRAEAEFQSTHDSTATEIWDHNEVLWRAGAASFVEK